MDRLVAIAVSRRYLMVGLFAVVIICDQDRGIPWVLLIVAFFLVFWTFIATRTITPSVTIASSGHSSLSVRGAGASTRLAYSVSAFGARRRRCARD